MQTPHTDQIKANNENTSGTTNTFKTGLSSQNAYSMNTHQNIQNISPITNITDKMNMGLNHPMAHNTPLQGQRHSAPGQENLILHSAQLPQKNILFEFKSRLENVELEFDEAKNEIERLKSKKGELECSEIQRKAEVDRLNQLNQELKKNYHYELEKVSNLNEIILNLRQELKSGISKTNQLSMVTGKFNSATGTIQELKVKIEQLEEAGDKKNLIVEKWKSTLLTLTERIGKIEEDNTYFEQERQLVKSTLTHVILQIYPKSNPKNSL